MRLMTGLSLSLRSLALVLILANLSRAEETSNWTRQNPGEKGDAQAQYVLGKSYVNGKGVPQDYVRGAELLRQAADQGNAAAQNDLGTLYALGHGVTNDPATANQSFIKAAGQGDALAQYNLGCSYELGRGVASNDLPKAIACFRQAARPRTCPKPKTVWANSTPRARACRKTTMMPPRGLPKPPITGWRARKATWAPAMNWAAASNSTRRSPPNGTSRPRRVVSQSPVQRGHALPPLRGLGL